MKNWTKVEQKGSQKYLKVYVHDITGDIKVIYPTAPKWARKAAMRIYRDLEQGGIPTKKGIKDIVCKFWAKIISEAEKER